MTTLSKSVLAFDLDFLIAETGIQLTGVSPPAIADRVFVGSFEALTEGYDVEISGRDVELDSHIVINGDAYPVLPEKGALLTDPDGTFHKVFEATREEFGPVYRMKVASRYTGTT